MRGAVATPIRGTALRSRSKPEPAVYLPDSTIVCGTRGPMRPRRTGTR